MSSLKFARQKYCERWGCTALWTHAQPAAHKTALVRTQDGMERQTMPPYYNKMIVLKRVLPHYDYIVFLDADVVITNFDLNITDFVLANQHGIAFEVQVNVFSKHSSRSTRLLDLWHDSAVGDGCRYRRFPYNYRFQSINGDMPWFWYAMLRLYEEYYVEHVDCIQPCSNTSWVHDCAKTVWRRPKAQRLLSPEHYGGKKIVCEMQWGNRRSAAESAKRAWMLHIKANNRKFFPIAEAIKTLHATGRWTFASV
tara:strand:- start:2289 stop:3047 length:759 start_codon:yes stop_codon:yes gene_type:complete